MTTVKIRTSDAGWAQRLGLPVGDEGNGHVLAAVQVADVERLTFGGVAMVRFHLGADLPRDYPNPWVMTPATYAS